MGIRYDLKAEHEYYQYSFATGLAYRAPDSSLVMIVGRSGAANLMETSSQQRRNRARCRIIQPGRLTEIETEERVHLTREGDTLYVGKVSLMVDSGATPGALILSKSRRGRDDAVASVASMQIMDRMERPLPEIHPDYLPWNVFPCAVAYYSGRRAEEGGPNCVSGAKGGYHYRPPARPPGPRLPPESPSPAAPDTSSGAGSGRAIELK